MKYLAILLFFITTYSNVYTQPAAEKEIRNVLDQQIVAWNAGDVEKFMKGYWNNDSLMFVGKSGVTYGYDNTLANYKKGYSDTASMGRLSFDILHVNQLSPEYYFVAGKFYLMRTKGNLQGHYTLLFRKINGKWMIVSDHSS